MDFMMSSANEYVYLAYRCISIVTDSENTILVPQSNHNDVLYKWVAGSAICEDEYVELYHQHITMVYTLVSRYLL